MKEYLHLFQSVQNVPTENGNYFTNVGERVYQDGKWCYEDQGLLFETDSVTHWLDLSKITTKEKAMWCIQEAQGTIGQESINDLVNEL